MSENILVVEYEPRYTDRVRQALAGQPFAPTFAKDGEEAIRALDSESPRLIVLSSVVPKISTTELIRTIRGRKALQDTPILLTVSGYSGKSPKQDAQRVGASDILPKPYSETEFLGKVQQMLGMRSEAPKLNSDFTVHPMPPQPVGVLTSTEIFGDILEDDRPVKKTNMGKATNDVDKMLADTLSGVLPQRKKDAQPAGERPVSPPTSPGTQPPSPDAHAAVPHGKRESSAELDKRLQDTLSGIEKNARKSTMSGNAPRPATAPGGAGPTPADRFSTEKMSSYAADRVPVSQPVFPQPAPEPARVEEEEPADGVKFGQYVLLEKIATGGMAEVWKARMRGVEGFQKVVAIKKILPHLSDNQDFIEMFVDEAKLAAQLNHNNIIHIYDLGKIQSSYYIAMEYIDGFDLKAILRRGEERGHPMQVELPLFITSKIASALDYAHRKRDFEEKEMGLVHRDVSPQNVLISQEGDIKLCDFGIAKAASKASHTQAGALKGKLQYMSPEQAWGRSIDRRSDIFALATVLFEMLSGRKLFTGDNELSILEQVREARIQPPSEFNDEVTPEIDAIVLKALQKDPANRYQTAGEMARDIDAVLYNFKPTPTSADLAIYMHRLSSPEQTLHGQAEPAAAPPPSVAPAPTVIQPVSHMAAPPAAHAPAAHPAAHAATAAAGAAVHATPVAHPHSATAEPWDQAKRKKSSAAPLIAVAAILLLAAGGGVWYFFLRDDGAPAVSTKIASAAKPTGRVATPAVLPLTATTATTTTTGTAPAATTQQAIDQALVDQEVQRRIAADRARFEAEARTQAATQTTAPARPAPAPVATQTTAPPPPPPVVTETRAAQPAPVEEEPAPAPAPAPVVARAREGDLVPAGTEGLTPPRLLRRGTVTYPPVARLQRAEGTVLTNVLISETGSVLEVRILRGVNRPVGLNEAATQTMRRSTFSPATKDGVRVKAWLTVPVEFKL